VEKKALTAEVNNPWFHNSVYRLEFEDAEGALVDPPEGFSPQLVIPKQLQRHWYNESPINLTLLEYKCGHKYKVDLPIRYENVPDCKGVVEQRGYLSFLRDHLSCYFTGDGVPGMSTGAEISAMPKEIELDLINMKVNDKFTTSDVAKMLPAGLTLRKPELISVLVNLKK
jgi:hypothetical protein